MSIDSMDAEDGSNDGLDDVDPQDQADANRPYGEVTAEDLSTLDLVADGADAADVGPDHGELEGVVPVDQHRDLDPETDETIEDRLQQEEPDPASAIVPPRPDRA
ncbi:hypothetical protein [Propioniciclava soli]|uniref:hypothetical protein n=1 Tax=Propioniciclava soli TaxID=2775081 RepID=UPI001E5536EA|nr:hypothetical protein [Propioniciclava soli]